MIEILRNQVAVGCVNVQNVMLNSPQNSTVVPWRHSGGPKNVLFSNIKQFEQLEKQWQYGPPGC